MSLILDALRKMEQERKARKQGATGLRQEVLNYRGGEAKPERQLILPIAAGLIVTASVVTGWFLLADRSEEKAKPVAATQVIPQSSAPSAPVQPAPVQPAPPPQANVPPQAGQQVTAPHPPAATVKPHAAAVQKQHRQEPPPVSTDSTLQVSGIAWQDERKARRAVVNGELVAEGGAVSGAKVIEIRENSVRFNRGGQILEVRYP